MWIKRKEPEMSTSAELGTPRTVTRYVLRETLASRKQGHPVYYLQWTGIGPMTTPHLPLAYRFDSAQSAMQSKAYNHFLSFFEPEPVEDTLP